MLILCVKSIQCDDVCSWSEHKAMQEDFTSCSREKIEENYNLEEPDTCLLLKKIINECGKLWERCYTSQEVRSMKDLHMEALVKQYSEEEDLDTCHVVEQYRQSHAIHPDQENDVSCTDDKMLDTQAKYQTCSHTTTTSVYQDIMDINSVETISSKLCQALTTIGTVCVKHLSECFAENDAKQMRKSSLTEMKAFLLRISQEKAPSNALDNCKIMEFDHADTENIIEQNDPKHDQSVKDEMDNSVVNIIETEEVATTSSSATSTPLQLKDSRSTSIETRGTSVETRVTSESGDKELDERKANNEIDDVVKTDDNDDTKDVDEVSDDTVKYGEESERLQKSEGCRTLPGISVVTFIVTCLVMVLG